MIDDRHDFNIREEREYICSKKKEIVKWDLQLGHTQGAFLALPFFVASEDSTFVLTGNLCLFLCVSSWLMVLSFRVFATELQICL